MSNHAVLNNNDHKNLKVITTRSEKYGDNVWFTMTFPFEFRQVLAHYPMFFQKDAETGAFYPVALFGFSANENLFLNGESWDVPYIPINQVRLPFLIGRQKVMENGKEVENRVVHIDMDHPRVNEAEGEALFGEMGGNTPYLDQIASMLEAMHQGVHENKVFIDALLDLELLEPFTLDVSLTDGSQNQLIGFYTINEEKLATLKGDVLEGLNSSGFLKHIYMILASQSKIQDLVNRKNKRVIKQAQAEVAEA